MLNPSPTVHVLQVMLQLHKQHHVQLQPPYQVIRQDPEIHKMEEREEVLNILHSSFDQIVLAKCHLSVQYLQ